MRASEKLIHHLSLGTNDAVVIHNPSNMFYITEGYTGEGSVFISQKRSVIITDFRYTEQAERQAQGFEVVMTDVHQSNDAWIAQLCANEDITSLRYEEDYLTVKQFAALKREVSDKVKFQPLNNAPEKLREVKTDREIECIRKACEITSKAFDEILSKIHEGMTETELRIELDFTQLRLGADGNSFDTIIASGENGSLCHAIPGARKLQRGDMITMDFGCKYGGYCSDMTRTVALGQPSDEMKRVYDTVYMAQKMAVDAVAPEKDCFEIDKVARDYINHQGYDGRFGHGLGHSLGIDIHENPRYSVSCHDITKPNMIITVEPGIYIPGMGGVRIEDSVLVTENGHLSLTTAPRELIIL